MHIITQENARHVMKHLIKLVVRRQCGFWYTSRPFTEAGSSSGSSLNSILSWGQIILSMVLFSVSYSYTLLRFPFSSALLIALPSWSGCTGCLEILYLNRWSELSAVRSRIRWTCSLWSSWMDHSFSHIFICAALDDGCPTLLRLPQPGSFSSASNCWVSMWSFIHHMTPIICLKGLHFSTKIWDSILVEKFGAVLGWRHWGPFWLHMGCIIVSVNGCLIDMVSWVLGYRLLPFLDINSLIFVGSNIPKLRVILFWLWSVILIELLSLYVWVMQIVLESSHCRCQPGFWIEFCWRTGFNDSLRKSVVVGSWPIMVFFLLSWIHCGFNHLTRLMGLLLL